ncbi:hypothetical protein GAO09_19310 [Rhizobiales bacterium RZME27]|uniref:Uncharacterized protein n=1 Tax=Endobacterium cereale TaxID=2663029 RepID=A0A6A8AEF6_9HYPH|nr:hypothetical protein [Endobacterium cereale]MQY48187.1 hypothetical protein [Endobacterium cereale]
MSFQFIQNPTGAAMTETDLITSALDQPMSFGSTFWDQAKGGVRESFGLGTIIREEELPPVLNNRPARGENPEARQRRYDAYAGSLSEDQYKASPSFRKDIPWQKGLSEERAAALADQDDLRKVREFYASKRPVTAFFGNLGGQALDPINYIPVAGEAVVAANTARFGRVAGRALTSSIDAAVNTAAAAVVTAPVRRQLGDDVSLQSTISQVAMAAVIGGAFGAVAGRFSRQTPAELRVEAERKLATLQNVQEARVALNDALDGMIHRGEATVSSATADVVARVADVELPKVVIERMARDMDAPSFDRLDALSRTAEINEAEISRLLSESMNNERFGSTRAAMIEADRLAERLKRAEDNLSKAPNDKELATRTARRDDAREVLRAHLAAIDDGVVQQIEDIDASLASRRQANEPVALERAQLRERADQLRSQARDQYWAERPRTVRQAASNAAQQGRAVNTSSPVIAPDPELAPAKVRVGKPEASREIAQQYRVDPDTGDFAEMAELDRLIAEGRLTDEDRAALAEADETIKAANSYGEAVKAFASCAI